MNGMMGGVQSQLMGLGGYRPAPLPGPTNMQQALQQFLANQQTMGGANNLFPTNPVLQGGNPPHLGGGAPPAPPAPTTHNGQPMSPLRAIFQDLQGGLNSQQRQNINHGHVPGGFNGDFMNVNRRGDVVSLIAQMLAHGGQLPGNFDAFAQYINQGLAGNQHIPGGDVGKIRPPVNPGVGILRRNAPRPPIMRQQMLQHFLQRAVR